MAVHAAKFYLLTVNIYNLIPDSDFPNTKRITDYLTAAVKHDRIQIWLFRIPADWIWDFQMRHTFLFFSDYHY